MVHWTLKYAAAPAPTIFLGALLAAASSQALIPYRPSGADRPIASGGSSLCSSTGMPNLRMRRAG
jgi:hypothetical protein